MLRAAPTPNRDLNQLHQGGCKVDTDETRRTFESYRRSEAGPVENALIDEFSDGVMDRGEFLRRAAMFGFSATTIGVVLRSLGHAPLRFGASRSSSGGGRILVGITPAPIGTLEPSVTSDAGGVWAEGIVGEFLTRTQVGLQLLPDLATSWKPNKDGSVWTFALRKGVKFQTGQTMTADDVVVTYQTLTNPKGDSGALSSFDGVLVPDGIEKVDDYTVAFHLESPNGSFPYLTCEATQEAIILPANYKTGTFTTTAQATGAFMITSYNADVGMTCERFDGWWGGTAPLDGVDVTFYADQAPANSALLAGDIDLLGEISYSGSTALFHNTGLNIISARSAAHREVGLRVDLSNPLHDYRVREAIALTLDRTAMVKAFFGTTAEVGNDSPFAPVYPSTVKVAQRHKDISKAKALMKAAGHEDGFSITLTAVNEYEIPELAQVIQSSVRDIGIKMDLKVEASTVYYGGSYTGPPDGYGSTPWLNAPMTATGYGGRATPNVYITSAFVTKGAWNASRYSNKDFDSYAKSYFAAVTLTDQRKYAKLMELLLLHDTPVIIPYFFDTLQAASKKVKGYEGNSDGRIYLSRTSLT